MMTYCPSCGMNVETVEKKSPRGKVWLCANCNLAFTSRSAPQQHDYPAPANSTAARITARAKAGMHAVQPKQQPQQETGPSWEKGGIELDENDAGDFVLESLSHEPILALIREETPRRGEASHANQGTRYERVALVEDATLLREMVKDALIESGISREVRGCRGGEEFLQAASEQLTAGGPFDLIILDVEMPLLNGYATAVALRAFERGLKAKPAPIIFFTAHACDENFRKVLEYCQPARYLNKGADASPPRIAERLQELLGSLKSQ